jgi:hypothetical protein
MQRYKECYVMLVHYFAINELPETYNFIFFQFPSMGYLACKRLTEGPFVMNSHLEIALFIFQLFINNIYDIRAFLSGLAQSGPTEMKILNVYITGLLWNINSMCGFEFYITSEFLFFYYIF